MLTSVHIQNFRAIRDLAVTGLKRINLIAGANNSGKTSFVEAVFFLAAAMRRDVPEMLNFSRMLQVKTADDIKSLFRNVDIQHSIKVQGWSDSGLTRSVELRMKPQDESSFQTYDFSDGAGTLSNEPLCPAIIQTYRIEQADGNALSGEINTLTDKEKNIRMLKGPAYADPWPSIYLNSKNNASVNPRLMSRFFKDRLENDVLKAIQGVDSSILNILSVDSDIMVDTAEARLPLQVAGDGVIKIVNILIAATYCKGGLLCIDEIENGLHYSAMRPFWKVLLAFARKHDVQVIATTHNLEMLQEAIGAVSGENEETFAFIRIAKRRDGEVVATPYTEDEYRMHIEEGIEIR